MWTNVRDQDFYRRFVRENPELFSEETVEEALREARLRQTGLAEFSA